MSASDDPPLTDLTGEGPGDDGAAGAVSRLLKDVLVGVGIVVVIVLVFFLISGVWPPFVAIESGSMEPHINQGDLVFLVQPDRLGPSEGVADTNLLTREAGLARGQVSFGEPGHVVVFKPNGGDDTPIIHRLHLWVDAGENWYDRADPAYVGSHRNCDELPNCPAPHSGFITKGDNNRAYDQVDGQTAVVKADWVEGRALVRLPYLGRLRVGL